MSNSSQTMSTFVHLVDAIDPLDTARFGGKATGLARMAAAGIPVPPAFVIGTDGYRAFREAGSLPAALVAQTETAILELERRTGRRFGVAAGGMPLLVSVRSGAQVSMPGMMDTVLNLGVTCESAERLAAQTSSADFAVDTWLRFWRMFSDIVLGIDGELVVEAAAPHVDAARAEPSRARFARLETAVLETLVREGAKEVRADPSWQLHRAVAAVFESWDSRRARAYRAHHRISDSLGTAVTIQAMVFGNLDADSGSGVAFTRDPNTGDPDLYGEYLAGRQGEDLVSGSATPQALNEPGSLSERHREELIEHGQRLEQMYSDAVDIEFTVESGRLYFLQVRVAKRTAQAAVRIAIDLVEEGLVGRATAIQRVSNEQLKKLIRPAFEAAALAEARVLLKGTGASPGHAYGLAVLDADRAAVMASTGERIVLLRPTTSPQDIRGMLACQAIVTAKGGALSHAAVVSRALDVPCVVGCDELEIDLAKRTFQIGGVCFEEGTPLSVDGATGQVYGGVLPLEPASQAAGYIDRLLKLADERSGASFSVSVTSGSDARGALRHAPRGLAVVALTDLMIAAGTLDELLDAINELGRDANRKPTHDRLARLSFEACRRLLLETPGTPVDIRLPNLGSPRAQRMISTWASLAPRLFLPLGLKGLYVPLLRGMADAAREVGHQHVTPLAAGINSLTEFSAFRAAAEAQGLARAGVVLQSPGGLFHARELAGSGAAVWIDIRELIRTFYGYPSALSFADDVFESYVADGYLPNNPRTALEGELARLLNEVGEFVEAPGGARFGVDCGEGAALSLIESLYRAGLRHFSVTSQSLSSVRLALGQLVVKDEVIERLAGASPSPFMLGVV